MIDIIVKLKNSHGFKAVICFAVIIAIVSALTFADDMSGEKDTENSKENSEESKDDEDDFLFGIHIGTGNTIALVGLIGALAAVEIKRAYDEKIKEKD